MLNNDKQTDTVLFCMLVHTHRSVSTIGLLTAFTVCLVFFTCRIMMTRDGYQIEIPITWNSRTGGPTEVFIHVLPIDATITVIVAFHCTRIFRGFSSQQLLMARCFSPCASIRIFSSIIVVCTLCVECSHVVGLTERRARTALVWHALCAGRPGRRTMSCHPSRSKRGWR